MELPTPEEFEKTCAEHLWLFTLEPDLTRAAKGLKTHNYIVDVIKKGGSVYKKIHRKAFENFIDNTTGNKP